MNILMLVPYYAPDLGPSAPLFTMLSEELVKRGHHVSVIATVPHYPTGTVPAQFRKKWIQRTTENEVEVIRVRIPSVRRASMAQRFLQYICYQIGATWAGMALNYEAAFVANPALWVWLPFAWLVALRRIPAIFSVQDVYPDVGVTLGIFRHKAIIKAVAYLERFCLKHSSVIQIISESFRPGLNSLGVLETKMKLIYNWVDTDFIKPLDKSNDFSEEHHLSTHFVVLYAGNIGLSQGLEHVLSAAEQLASYVDILFVFVGDGAGKANLLADAEKRQVRNVKFIPFQPRERLPEVLASADVSLVILRTGIGFGSLPSKTFSIFASSRPIIASVDERSETWNLIQQAEAGICVQPENSSELADAILRLRQDPPLRERLGCNARNWALLHHSPQIAAEMVENLLINITTK